MRNKVIEKVILDYLQSIKKPVSCLNIAINTGISYPTILSHIGFLKKNQMIDIQIVKEKLKLVKLSEVDEK